MGREEPCGEGVPGAKRRAGLKKEAWSSSTPAAGGWRSKV